MEKLVINSKPASAGDDKKEEEKDAVMKDDGMEETIGLKCK